MKELDPLVLLAVLEEMLGPLVWVLAAAVLVGSTAFIWLLVKDGGLHARRLLWSQVAGLFGGFLALALMIQVSSSGYLRIGGPADWFLIALVYGAGVVVSAVLIYTLSGCWQRCRPRQA